MILYIDHYDSFTNTIVDYISYLGYEVIIKKTDDNFDDINQYSHIIIGPGPGHPDEVKHLYEVIKYCDNSNINLLGICLGHQLVAQYYGSNVAKAKTIFHGRNSIIATKNSALFKGLPSEFEVTRYHSLIVYDVKPPLQITAKTSENEIMAFEHKIKNIFGLQYHPEAYLTNYGVETLNNFLKINYTF